MLKVQGDIAQLCFGVVQDFLLGHGGEAVAMFFLDLHDLVCEVPLSLFQVHDGMGESIAVVDLHSVGDQSLESISVLVI